MVPTEAKYRALAATTIELMWFMNLIHNLGYTLLAPTLCYDNISALNMAKSPVFHHRTKHIEIDPHLVREKVAHGTISLAHILGNDQVANVFTKSLCGPRFLPCQRKLHVGPILP